MDELPELPFEKVLSYLSLEDRLKAKAVSRRWYWMISNLVRVKTLCYSQRPAGFIQGKRRLISGAFAQNFICSTRFASFFATFGSTILSNLKHLRLCDFSVENLPAFVSTLQSFGQLEELDIIRFNYLPNSTAEEMIKLSLPMLTSIWLERVNGIWMLTLDSPRLQKAKVLQFFGVRLEFIHPESVEWLKTEKSTAKAVEKMKNLQVLYVIFFPMDPTVLSSLQKLREIHVDELDGGELEKLFEQKQRHRRTDLKVYLRGLLLNGPDDPAIHSLQYSDKDTLRYLVENPSKLADQIPFWDWLSYRHIERIAGGTEINLLKRITHLNWIRVDALVEDTERFLGILKNFDNIVRFDFWNEPQPQGLFDRLPELCTVQFLTISANSHLDVRFLFRLKQLIGLNIECCSIDAGTIRNVIEANEFLCEFRFKYLNNQVLIKIEYPKQFKVQVNYHDRREVPDLDAAIELITADSRPKKQRQ